MNWCNMHIVFMRPYEQSNEWGQKLAKQGAKVTLLPMLETIPVPLDPNVVAKLSCADSVIIGSQNAVTHAPIALLEVLIQKNIPITTMGGSTTKALAAKGISVTRTAPSGSQSETLLEWPEWQAEVIRGQTVFLLIGRGGRNVLADELASRGAKIITLHVYEQQAVSYDLDPYCAEWNKLHYRHCFVVTSGNILHNLCSQISNKYQKWLQKQQLVVISDRIAMLAKQYEFQHIYNAKGADFQSVVNVLQSIVKVCNTE